MRGGRVQQGVVRAISSKVRRWRWAKGRCSAWLAGFVLAVAAPARGAAPQHALEELEHWVAEHKSDRKLSFEELDGLEYRLQRLEQDEPLDFEQRQRALETHIEVMNLEAVLPDPVRLGGGRFAALRLREKTPRQLGLRYALVQLERGAPPRLDLWLAQTFLAAQGLLEPTEAARQARRRSLAAIEIMGRRRSAATVSALFACATSGEPHIERAGWQALTGWHTREIDRFMLVRLTQLCAEGAWTSAHELARHFHGAQFPLSEAKAEELAAHCRNGLIGSQWRDVVRTVRLTQLFPDEWIVPALIESLAVWIDRRDDDRGRLRVESDLIGALEKRSGRSIGAHPERWAIWWNARRRGLASSNDPAQRQLATQATFFGIPPSSDRVCFVLDASGSMETPFAAAARPMSESKAKSARRHSRYDEALQQMRDFLRGLGPTARFSLVCFNDGARMWRRELQLAQPAAIDDALAWARSQGPGGGTELRAGIATALAVDRAGALDPGRIEADTLIVLCDGETAEGPGWIPAFFERAVPLTCIAVHAVQIGGSSDGALEQMAELSGGDYVEVK